MQTGKLDQRVTLKTPTTTNNGGQVQDAYADIATVWAEVIEQRGSEAFEAARVDAQRMIRVRIRYRDDVDTKSVISWQGQDTM